MRAFLFPLTRAIVFLLVWEMIECICTYRTVDSDGRTFNFDLSRLEYFPFEYVEFGTKSSGYVLYLSLCSPLKDLPASYVGSGGVDANNSRAVIFMRSKSLPVSFREKTVDFFPDGHILRVKFESRKTCNSMPRSTSQFYHITLNLKLSEEHDQPEFKAFNERNCEFVFDWKTFLATPVESVTSCSYVHQNGVLNLNWLKHPLKHHAAESELNGLTVFIKFCEFNNDETSHKKFSLVKVFTEDKSKNKTVVVHISNDSCGYDELQESLNCNTEDLSTHPFYLGLSRVVINLVCDPTEFHVRPVALRRKKGKILIQMKTFVACTEKPTCFVISDDKLYNISAFKNVDFNVNNSRYFFSICGSLVANNFPWQLTSSGILVRNGTDILSLGRMRQLKKVNENSVLLTLTGGSHCGYGNERIQTEILFVCSTTNFAHPILVDSQNNCKYHFMWEQTSVCPYSFFRNRSCSMRDPFTGFSCNLTDQDGHNEFLIYQGELTFVMNLCGTTGLHCNFSQGISVCLRKNNEEFILGRRSTQHLTYDKFFLTFEMTGEKCHSDVETRVRVEVVCDYGASNDSQPFIKAMDWKICLFHFIWITRKACPPEEKIHSDCRVKDSSGNEYDLSPLRRNSSNYRLNLNETSAIILNVCGRLWYGTDEMCPINAAVCLISNKKSEILGYLSAAHTSVDERGNVLQVYSSQFLCPKFANSYTGARITFRCGTGNGFPKYLGYRDCHHQFEWETVHVCPLAVSQRETVRGIVKSSELHSSETTPDSLNDKTSEKRQFSTQLMYLLSKKERFSNVVTPSYDMQLSFSLKQKDDSIIVQSTKTTMTEKSVVFPSFDQWNAMINKTAKLYSNIFNPVLVPGGVCHGSMSCLVISNSRYISLGSHWGQPSYLGNSLLVNYFNGSICNGSKKLRYSSSSTFSCNRSRSEKGPKLLKSSNFKPCHFDFQWETNWTCFIEAITFRRTNCTLMNRKTGKWIDLKPVFERELEVVSSRSIRFELHRFKSLCAVNTLENSNVTSMKNSRFLDFTDYSYQMGLYSSLVNTTFLSFSGNRFCSDSGNYGTLEIRLKCCEEEGKNWTLEGTECHVILLLESPHLCFTSTEETGSNAWIIWLSLAIFLCLLIVIKVFFKRSTCLANQTLQLNRGDQHFVHYHLLTEAKRTKSH